MAGDLEIEADHVTRLPLSLRVTSESHKENESRNKKMGRVTSGRPCLESGMTTASQCRSKGEVDTLHCRPITMV